MELLSLIVEKTNSFLRELQEISYGGNPIYIFGAGCGGEQVANQLVMAGIKYDGMVVDREYWNNEDNVLCLDEVLGQTERPINLIIGFRGFLKEKELPYRNRINYILDKDCWAGNKQVDSTYLTYEWVEENCEKLECIYKKLSDEKSKKVFVAFLNQKISMNWGYLNKTKSDHQYFEESLVKFSEHEVFVDCGAYDGDTALAFIEALDRQGISSYDAIYSFEPDADNYEKLIEKGLKNHHCIQKGLTDVQGNAKFSKAGTSGRIIDGENTSEDQNAISLETIDNALAGQRTTMIKMDIEGFELAALKGAKNTIKQYKPMLAICVYHKKEDLWEIADYIHSLVPEYKLYMRNYENTATELVLYAII